MNKIIFLLFFVSTSLSAQTLQYNRSVNDTTQTRDLIFDEELYPFYHGVASGDPLSDRVIIWTRVTPETNDEVEVFWRVATDIDFNDVVQQGTTTTNSSVDFTVKIDVTGLNPETTYYYHFFALNHSSLIGRTRTAPINTNHLRFAITSCSNYQAGYFIPYRKIAERKDLDAVLHLGDYIYEYGGGPGTYGWSFTRADRTHEPTEEILTLVDYRTRYSLYRLDPDLRAVHQQNPFIAVWDDHESANDSYVDGAENHNEGEGDWEERKAISKQVYFEWMPIRNHPDKKIMRTLSYGNLATIINLDTRLEGREVQITDASDPALYDEERTLLGEAQRDWFFDELDNASAKWKLVSNQVMLSEFNLGWATLGTGLGANQLESLFLDIWDGYPAERDRVIEHIRDNSLDNVVFLTGDIHTTFSFDVAKRPTDNHPGGDPIDYDPETGEGSVAVEFVGPSITSDNFDETLTAPISAIIASGINTPAIGNLFQNPNPHMKYKNLDDHGYYILDLKDSRAQGDYFFTNILNEQTTTETTGESWYTEDGENHLVFSSNVAPEKEIQPDLAPMEVPIFPNLSIADLNDSPIAVFSLYPNPVASNGTIFIQYGTNKSGTVLIELYDLQGRKISELLKEDISTGIFISQLKLNQVSSGTYLLKMQVGKDVVSKKLIVK